MMTTPSPERERLAKDVKASMDAYYQRRPGRSTSFADFITDALRAAGYIHRDEAAKIMESFIDALKDVRPEPFSHVAGQLFAYKTALAALRQRSASTPRTGETK